VTDLPTERHAMSEDSDCQIWTGEASNRRENSETRVARRDGKTGHRTVLSARKVNAPGPTVRVRWIGAIIDDYTCVHAAGKSK
jgi:hypothetical protein